MSTSAAYQKANCVASSVDSRVNNINFAIKIGCLNSLGKNVSLKDDSGLNKKLEDILRFSLNYDFNGSKNDTYVD